MVQTALGELLLWLDHRRSCECHLSTKDVCFTPHILWRACTRWRHAALRRSSEPVCVPLLEEFVLRIDWRSSRLSSWKWSNFVDWCVQHATSSTWSIKKKGRDILLWWCQKRYVSNEIIQSVSSPSTESRSIWEQMVRQSSICVIAYSRLSFSLQVSFRNDHIFGSSAV